MQLGMWSAESSFFLIGLGRESMNVQLSLIMFLGKLEICYSSCDDNGLLKNRT